MIVSKSRMEYFSDGIMAIAITIMVLDIELTKFPTLTRANEWDIMVSLLPRFLVYLLSFVILGVMWVNHHTFYHMIKYVDIKLLWYNLHLLFWLTLVPFATSMISKFPSLPLPLASYGFIMFMSSLAFNWSRIYAVKKHMIYAGHEKELNDAIDKLIARIRMKITVGVLLYSISIPVAFISIYLAYVCIVAPAVLYLVPEVIEDKKLARTIYRKLIRYHH